MSVYLSPNLVLSAEEADFPDGVPLIGYHNVVTELNVSATTADSDFPASNLGNPATHLYWKSTMTSGDETITVETGYGDDIDYIGIARHNFGSDSVAVLVEGGSPDTLYNKVTLHLSGTDGSTSFPDVNTAGSAHTWTTHGNAQVDTADSFYGGGALLCDGSGDYIDTPDHADFALGSNNFTIRCKFKTTAAGGTQRNLAGQVDNANTATTKSFHLIRTSINTMSFQVRVGATGFTVLGTTSFTDVLNPGWHDLEVCRTGNTLKMFLDGVQEGGDVAITGSINDSTNNLSVGRLGEIVGTEWLGSIEEFLIFNGIALHTSNFTPPRHRFDGNLYSQLADEFMPSTDDPILIQFTPAVYPTVRLTLGIDSTAPYAAVLYVGKLLIMERSISIDEDHTPITQGRMIKSVNGLSTSGNFLGRIVVGETRQSIADFKWITPDFYRASVDPFVIASQEAPFFFAWNPSEYPEDVGYCWAVDEPIPEVDTPTRRVALKIKMQGVA